MAIFRLFLPLFRGGWGGGGGWGVGGGGSWPPPTPLPYPPVRQLFLKKVVKNRYFLIIFWGKKNRKKVSKCAKIAKSGFLASFGCLLAKLPLFFFKCARRLAPLALVSYLALNFALFRIFCLIRGSRLNALHFDFFVTFCLATGWAFKMLIGKLSDVVRLPWKPGIIECRFRLLVWV